MAAHLRVKHNDIVIPGDALGLESKYKSGAGTTIRRSTVFSTLLGRINLETCHEEFGPPQFSPPRSKYFEAVGPPVQILQSCWTPWSKYFSRPLKRMDLLVVVGPPCKFSLNGWNFKVNYIIKLIINETKIIK